MRRLLVFSLILALAAPASAARYVVVPVESGALRLDTETGEIYLCTVSGGGYSCNRLAGGSVPGPGDTLRLEAEISALQAEVAALSGRSDLSSPAQSAVGRVGILAERIMRHFLGVVADFKREVGGTSS
jgi:hypothetical protein